MSIGNCLSLLISFLLLTSCSALKKVSGTSFQDTDGKILLSNEDEGVFIQFPSDYWFHNLNQQITLNWNKQFIDSFNSAFKSSPKVLYSSHTIVDPYCTSVGLIYRNKVNIEQFATSILNNLKTESKLTNVVMSSININSLTGVKINYDLYNETLKIYSRHVEYYFSSNDKIIRMIFWSTVFGRESWLEGESNAIVKTVYLK